MKLRSRYSFISLALSKSSKIENTADPEPEIPVPNEPKVLPYSRASVKPGMRLARYGSAITSCKVAAASLSSPVWHA